MPPPQLGTEVPWYHPICTAYATPLDAFNAGVRTAPRGEAPGRPPFAAGAPYSRRALSLICRATVLPITANPYRVYCTRNVTACQEGILT